MQSLAEKAPNLRIAGGACKREFVSYVLALSISYWLLLEMWCWPRQTLGLARPSVFLFLFRLLVLRCCTLHWYLTGGKVVVEKTTHVNQAFCSVSWYCFAISSAEAAWPSEIHEANVLQIMKCFSVNVVPENSWGFSCPWFSSWAVMRFIGIKGFDLLYFSRFFPRFGW